MTQAASTVERQPSIEMKLREAGLRPTRQRTDLARLLFGNGNRHVTTEMLHAEAPGKNVSVSLATVYNTLNQFARAGLLREVASRARKPISTRPLPITSTFSSSMTGGSSTSGRTKRWPSPCTNCPKA